MSNFKNYSEKRITLYHMLAKEKNYYVKKTELLTKQCSS